MSQDSRAKNYESRSETKLKGQELYLSQDIRTQEVKIQGLQLNQKQTL